MKKTANSSDEEEALKKFAEKSEKDSTVVSQKKAEEEKIDSAQAESNLAAFLSESDENESKSEKKKEADTSNFCFICARIYGREEVSPQLFFF